jgi:hypothetical protein
MRPDRALQALHRRFAGVDETLSTPWTGGTSANESAAPTSGAIQMAATPAAHQARV